MFQILFVSYNLFDNQPPGKKYIKFGIVDYGHAGFDNFIPKPDIHKQLYGSKLPELKSIFDGLTKEDFYEAAKELGSPKERELTKEGYLITAKKPKALDHKAPGNSAQKSVVFQGPGQTQGAEKSKGTADTVIDQITKETIAELRRKYPKGLIGDDPLKKL